jgi:hypothetical protein
VGLSNSSDIKEVLHLDTRTTNPETDSMNEKNNFFAAKSDVKAIHSIRRWVWEKHEHNNLLKG